MKRLELAGIYVTVTIGLLGVTIAACESDSQSDRPASASASAAGDKVGEEAMNAVLRSEGPPCDFVHSGMPHFPLTATSPLPCTFIDGHLGGLVEHDPDDPACVRMTGYDEKTGKRIGTMDAQRSELLTCTTAGSSDW